MKNVECIFIDDLSREITEQIMNSVKGIDLLESPVEEFQLEDSEKIVFTDNHRLSKIISMKKEELQKIPPRVGELSAGLNLNEYEK